MTCSLCLVDTPELQTIGADGKCPLCGTDYSAYAHTSSVARVALSVALSPWQQTRKLVPQGAAFRDRLVAARINLRSDSNV